MPKAKGADFPNKKIAGEFDGYSAVWSKSTLPVNLLKKLLQLTE